MSVTSERKAAQAGRTGTVVVLYADGRMRMAEPMTYQEYAAWQRESRPWWTGEGGEPPARVAWLDEDMLPRGD